MKTKIINNISHLEKKYAWSLFGLIVVILGFGYAIYVDNFKGQKPEIIFEILSNTNISYTRPL